MLWVAKALVQSALSLLPGGEELNFRLQKRSALRSPQNFTSRILNGVAFLESISSYVDVRNKRVLEIGTGWDGLHTVLLAALGAREIITFDHVAHLRFNELRKVLAALRERSSLLSAVYGELASSIDLRLSAFEREPDIQRTLSAMNVIYRAPADATRTGLETGSVDLVYSFLVMSFVSASLLAPMAAETQRVLRPGGLAVHHIRMSDPYAPINGNDDLGYLAIPEVIWKLICNNAIQRNNRLRASAYLPLFTGATDELVWSQRELKPENLARISGLRLAEPFRALPPEDLATTSLSMVVRHG